MVGFFFLLPELFQALDICIPEHRLSLKCYELEIEAPLCQVFKCEHMAIILCFVNELKKKKLSDSGEHAHT